MLGAGEAGVGCLLQIKYLYFPESVSSDPTIPALFVAFTINIKYLPSYAELDIGIDA